jgi:hypothetical protein
MVTNELWLMPAAEPFTSAETRAALDWLAGCLVTGGEAGEPPAELARLFNEALVRRGSHLRLASVRRRPHARD